MSVDISKYPSLKANSDSPGGHDSLKMPSTDVENPAICFRDYHVFGDPASGAWIVIIGDYQVWAERLGLNPVHELRVPLDKTELRSACYDWMAAQ